MNKLLNIIKILLILLLIYFNILCKTRNLIASNIVPVFIIIELVYIILTIKDYKKKNKINLNKMYLILNIIVLIITNFIFIRLLYDQNFIYNDLNNYTDLYNYFNPVISDYTNATYYQVIWLNTIYLEQNMIYLIPLFISLLIYRKVNLKEIDNH